MESEPGGYYTSTAFLRTTFLTITFTSFYFYETGQDSTGLNLQPAKKPVNPGKEVNTITVKKKKKKTVYLTFDDGPNKGTKNVLDIINTEQIAATLFLVGEHVYGSRMQQDIYDSIKNNELIEIANHSYTHGLGNNYRFYYANEDTVVRDFKRCADNLGLTTGIIRTPGRNIWRTKNINSTDLKSSIAAADSLEKKGYKILGWDLEWHFNKQNLVQTKEQLLQQIDSLFLHNKTKTKDHLVLLAHDQIYTGSEDSASLHQFISELKQTGEYDFERVSGYPDLDE